MLLYTQPVALPPAIDLVAFGDRGGWRSSAKPGSARLQPGAFRVIPPEGRTTYMSHAPCM